MRVLTVHSNRSETAGLMPVVEALRERGAEVEVNEIIDIEWIDMRFRESYDAAMWGADVLLVYGDRIEQIAAAAGAHATDIPIAHIHGGEYTWGSKDNRARWAISMLAEWHFAATKNAASELEERIPGWIAYGRVYHTGAPSLDDLSFDPWPHDPGFILCTVHPCDDEDPEEIFNALHGERVIFTTPNGEPGSRKIRNQMRNPMDMGLGKYRSAMWNCKFMIGNSSSGIIEAPSFGCPVINVGSRQDGRERAGNVIDVPCEAGAILEAIRNPPERKLYHNPYRHPEGKAAETIAEVLCASFS